jgi:hypothetical protein
VVKAIEMGLMRVFPADMVVNEMKGNDRNWTLKPNWDPYLK